MGILNNAINKETVFIVDCRNSDELINDGNLKSMGVKNVVNIPSEKVESALSLSPEDFKEKYGVEIFPKGTKVVVHCRSGRRSVPVTAQFKSAGYDAHNYEGGFEGWKQKFDCRNF